MIPYPPGSVELLGELVRTWGAAVMVLALVRCAWLAWR